MPRACGVSLTSTVWPMRRRPSERSVSSCCLFEPFLLLTCVTFTTRAPPPPPRPCRSPRRRIRCPPAPPRPPLERRGGGAVAPQPEDLVDRQAAQLGDLVRRAQGLEALDRRLDEVDRVLRAERLAQDVVDPRELQDGAHAAARDDAGALGGGLEEHLAGAELTGDGMGDRRAVLRHAEQVLLRALDALLDRERDLVGLAVADADDLALVAHDHEGREREPPAALDDLGDAVDLDDPLLQVEAGRADGPVDAVHTVSPPSRTPSANALTRP